MVVTLSHLFSNSLKQKKEEVVFLWFFYGRFFSNKIASKAPTAMITTNRPAIAGIKYVSAIDCGAGVAGVGVGAVGSTVKAVSACEVQ